MKNNPLTLWFISLYVSLLFSSPALGQWSSDPTVNTAICTTAGDQRWPAIASDGAGGAIISWLDRRSGSFAIYAQRIDHLGIVRWTANGILISTFGITEYSQISITSDSTGGAIITWCGLIGIENSDIYAQRVDSSGSVRWAANGVAICTATRNQYDPIIASDGAGGAIIAWDDYRGVNGDIYAQWIDSSGTVRWTANGRAICTASGEQFITDMVSDDGGGAIISWMDERDSAASGFDIYAQRIDRSGTIRWIANGVAICTAASDQYSPNIQGDGAGGAIIAWGDDRNSAGSLNADIYAQQIDGSGTIRWIANGVAICTAASDQYSPTIEGDGAGGAIIAWDDYRSSNADIYAQRVSNSGTVQWTLDGVAISTATGYQFYPTIVSDGSGGAIITWNDGFFVNADIRAQRIDSSGAVRWAANGVAICTATRNQYDPIIASDGSGGAIITWTDERDSTTSSLDIYTQQVSASGHLGQITSVVGMPRMPTEFTLQQNYPNPFNPTTTIRYELPKATHVLLVVYDILGQFITTLVDKEQSPGIQEITFDGSLFPSGVYFCRIRAGSFADTKKLVLLR